MSNPALHIDTGAQSPLAVLVTETDIRGNPWPEGKRITIVQDESDTFSGSNLTFAQAEELTRWLNQVLFTNDTKEST